MLVVEGLRYNTSGAESHNRCLCFDFFSFSLFFLDLQEPSRSEVFSESGSRGRVVGERKDSFHAGPRTDR